MQLLFLVCLISVLSIDGLRSNLITRRAKAIETTALNAAPSHRLSNVLASAVLFSTILLPLSPSPTVSSPVKLSVANADDDSKSAKKFETCVSKCVFNGTKPPPVGSDFERLEETSTKPRSEFIIECRKSCAKNKEQGLLGTPKKISTPQQAAPIPAAPVPE